MMKRCDKCNGRSDLYMVTDELWAAAALNGWACFRCVEAAIGRRLVPTDFKTGLSANSDYHEPDLRARIGLASQNESTAADALRYAAAILRQRAEWTTDAIGGSDCSLDHETELDAILDICHEISELAAQFGDPRRYSDGRLVLSRKEIQRGLTTEHVWQPDPAQEQPRSWRDSLPSDPDVPSPGVFEVTTDPQTQDVHVRVVRMA